MISLHADHGPKLRKNDCWN